MSFAIDHVFMLCDDEAQAAAEPVVGRGLLTRWKRRGSGACPFGVVLRAEGEPDDAEPPFPSWPYRPSYLP